ncbi:MAG: hypothetical protein NUV65_07005, partial [Candidatus Roizmanbacteria bacterium]|nr:hypothetical protein [Candidatus Roizmanbacteria bacterium]
LNPIVQRINITALTQIVYSAYYNKYFGYHTGTRNIYSSSDQKNWTLLATGSVGAALECIETYGQYVAVIGSYASQGHVWRSVDGITFTETPITAAYQFTNSFCDKSNGDLYVTGGKNSDGSAFIAKSSDFLTFAFSASYGAGAFTAIAYLNGKWIAYKGGAVTYYEGLSYDALTGTGVFPVAVAAPIAYQRPIAFGNDTWIVCGGSSLLYSTDAVNWTNSFYANLTSVATIAFLEKAGIFIMGGGTGSSGFVFSLDGTKPFSKYSYTPSAMTFLRFEETEKSFIVTANTSYIATGQQFSY